jgi:hypothetical protein
MVIRIEGQQQHAQRAGALRLGQAIAVEILGRDHAVRGGLARFAVDAPRHGLQQLARILEITAPQQRRAFAARRKAASAVIRSSATTTRRGGGRPARDRQHARQARPSSSHSTNRACELMNLPMRACRIEESLSMGPMKTESAMLRGPDDAVNSPLPRKSPCRRRRLLR